MIDPRNPDFSNTPASSQRPGFHYVTVDLGAKPVVTFVTPFYNAGSHFDETACCIQRQSLQQWEWIIVNDGSSDPSSVAVLDRYRDRDPRIRVIDHERNLGVSAARNRGFREARTEYVVQLDSDDLLEATTAEKMFWFFQSFPQFSFVNSYTVGFGAETYLWRNGFHSRDQFLTQNLVDGRSMVRQSVHQAVGGYDEQNRAGLEDWEFWLRCAHGGYWGDTLFEFMTWYRRRTTHHDRWPNWDGGSAQERFHQVLRERYASLWDGSLPNVERGDLASFRSRPEVIPAQNLLAKTSPRILLILPWLTMGGSDKFNLDLVQQLIGRGWEVTIATTTDGDNSWEPEFARFTPDIFVLQRFLQPADYPRFLRYLIGSRAVDTVVISHSEFGYLTLPYLRSTCPQPSYIDYCHIDEPDWKDGGYPRMATRFHQQLDLSIVSSHYLKRWMVERGAAPHRIEVCYTGIDADLWKPDADVRKRVREKLEINSDLPVILYAGRLAAQKQPHIFAMTINALKRQMGRRRFLALVAGDGEFRVWLEDYIRQHRLEEYIRLLGSQTLSEMKDLVLASDVFFLPSRWEGIALSIYEAMAAGLAVVGADVGGQSELVDKDGVLLPRPQQEAREVTLYASALARLLRNHEQRRFLGGKARRRVSEAFGLRHMGDTMVDLMHKAARSHQMAPRDTVSTEAALASAEEAVAGLIADREWVATHPPSPALLPALSEQAPEQTIFRSLENLYSTLRRQLTRLSK